MNFNPYPHIQFSFQAEPKTQAQKYFKQVHGNSLISLYTEKDLAHALANPAEADGAISFLLPSTLHCYSADCVPLLFFSSNPKGPIAAVHSGWRSTLKNIASLTLSKMNESLERVHVVVGPSIRGCCYEIRQDFVEAFEAQCLTIQAYTEQRNGKLYFDLPTFIIKEQLNSLPSTHIHLSHLQCTYCHPNQWPSYRRNKNTDPQIRSSITLIAN